ncbi:anti-sigma factor [Devosia sp.]|uniref:anti-sigma factor family protein n=1 Tax=Devosia sp. TaxID=1871048 RepID=UPI001B040C5B|nr:anti-sigma factor [Devosia sp.]MBO9590007.1 anti-sigma factor [Devosia sp.]
MSEISRDTLMAYADGALSPAERAEVDAYLADRPDAATEVALMQRQANAIRTLYGPVAAEPVPPRLSVDKLLQTQQKRRSRFWTSAAAAVVLVGLGLGSGWLLRGQADTPGIADQLIADAVSAHTVYVLENRHAVEVNGADSEHLSSWLSNRLQTTLAMPDLSASGLTFLGGRLLPAPNVPGGRAAQLMYEDTTGARLTLYVTPSPGPNTPSYELANLGLDTALFWADDVISCTITAPYPADRLQAIAKTVFSQLNPSGPDYRT